MRRLSLEQTLELTRSVAGPRDLLPPSTDVLIVGAGPVGLTVLNLLARYGISCTVIERNERTSDLPKAIAVDDEYLRLLAGLGLADAVHARASAPFGVFFTSARGRPLVTVPPFRTPNGFGNRVAVSQPLFEQTLLQGVPRQHASICFGAEFTGLSQGADHVEARVRVGGEERALTARYLLACDGARSPVRTAVGIDFPGRRIDEPHLVVDLAEFPDDTPGSRFFCDPRRPMNSIPAPFGGRRLEFMLAPGEDHDWLMSDQGIRWLIDNFSPYRGLQPKIIRRAIYGFSERIADRMQQGRVFLLGDAAHVMPPFGGQGLNTGARDAANLAWKLASVLQKNADPKLLSSYDVERRAQVSRAVRYSVNVGRLANIRSRPLALLRNAVVRLLNQYPPARDYLAQMRYVPRPRIDEGLLVTAGDAAADLVGTVFPRLMLDVDGAAITFDEFVGFRHALVVLDPPGGFRVPPQLIDAMSGVVLPMRSGKSMRGLAGCTDPLLDRLLPQLAGHAVLVRPDRYIAGAAPVQEAAGLLSAYRDAWSASGS
ncbi:MAG: FAD-dependent monooxygenase [Burkholderiaceae bacterium]